MIGLRRRHRDMRSEITLPHRPAQEGIQGCGLFHFLLEAFGIVFRSFSKVDVDAPFELKGQRPIVVGVENEVLRVPVNGKAPGHDTRRFRFGDPALPQELLEQENPVHFIDFADKPPLQIVHVPPEGDVFVRDAFGPFG